MQYCEECSNQRPSPHPGEKDFSKYWICLAVPMGESFLTRNPTTFEYCTNVRNCLNPTSKECKFYNPKVNP